jgi:hypothetical protein
MRLNGTYFYYEYKIIYTGGIFTGIKLIYKQQKDVLLVG